jgi:hypothetical protein
LSEEDAEKLIILMIGSSVGPVPSFTHMQKEMFILSRTFPKVEDLFYFEHHYLGAYSQILDGLIKEPAYYPEVYSYNIRGIFLTVIGKKTHDEIIYENRKSETLNLMRNSMKMIRQLYDRLTTNELLLLMYLTYPEYTDKSSVYAGLVENAAKRNNLIENIKRKGLITEDRYEELRAMKF